jgi:hypothetical protein
MKPLDVITIGRSSVDLYGLHFFNLIVGIEEEFHIAGGTTDTIAALRAVRAVSAAARPEAQCQGSRRV